MRAFIAAMATCIALSATPANAAPETELVTAKVVSSDLDLTTEAGRAALDERIRRAARSLCRPPRTYNGLPGHLPEKACVEAVTLSARENEHRPHRSRRNGGTVEADVPAPTH